nr:unnamed protein product [Callosobruchus analis]
MVSCLKLYFCWPCSTETSNIGIFHSHLSIGEAMVKYFGHHSSKLFIRGKPVRFGYKEWMLCSSTGYCYNFDVYCGAKPSTPALLVKLKINGRPYLLDLE